LAFFEPVVEGPARDAKDAADPAHGGALLVGGQHLCPEGGGVAAVVLALVEGVPTVMAAEALDAALVTAMLDDVLALAVAAQEDFDNHDHSLP